MRFYRHTTYGRTEPAWINYLWCGNCHAYSSSFTGGRKMLESDPLFEQDGDPIAEVFRDPERLFKIPDAYWKAGKLPQVISRRPAENDIPTSNPGRGSGIGEQPRVGGCRARTRRGLSRWRGRR
ncbi:hypothetical protein [Streptomyces sp. NPDC001137]|uniref:hypothetical protein n=1 Tax=Streptomyces sp. NPDC001137 TaxID=3154378 RepID=UPI0033226784